MRQYTVGTRGSALALWQTRHVTSRLAPRAGDIVERIITTQGDVNLTERLQGNIEKGFFTQELEAALHRAEIDWAVHSLKDLPTRMPAGLALGAVLERAPAADLLLVREDALDATQRVPVRAGGRVGSSSLRREHLLRRYAPQCQPVPLRGNVPTRVEKLRKGLFEAILLAQAGVKRLGLDLSGLHVLELNPRRWVCAPGQGAVAVQCREGDPEVLALTGSLDHPATRAATAIERDFLKVLEGGCTTPFGCFVEGGVAHLGLLTERGFRLAQVSLPSSPTPAYMQDQLERLTAHTLEEPPDEWLARRL
jgi:hydroxymethylbilane synthase